MQILRQQWKWRDFNHLDNSQTESL